MLPQEADNAQVGVASKTENIYRTGSFKVWKLSTFREVLLWANNRDFQEKNTKSFGERFLRFFFWNGLAYNKCPYEAYQ